MKKNRGQNGKKEGNLGYKEPSLLILLCFLFFQVSEGEEEEEGDTALDGIREEMGLNRRKRRKKKA